MTIRSTSQVRGGCSSTLAIRSSFRTPSGPCPPCVCWTTPVTGSEACVRACTLICARRKAQARAKRGLAARNSPMKECLLYSALLCQRVDCCSVGKFFAPRDGYWVCSDTSDCISDMMRKVLVHSTLSALYYWSGYSDRKLRQEVPYAPSPADDIPLFRYFVLIGRSASALPVYDCIWNIMLHLDQCPIAVLHRCRVDIIVLC